MATDMLAAILKTPLDPSPYAWSWLSLARGFPLAEAGNELATNEHLRYSTWDEQLRGLVDGARKAVKRTTVLSLIEANTCGFIQATAWPLIPSLGERVRW